MAVKRVATKMYLPLGALLMGATAPIALSQTASPPPLPTSLPTGSVVRIDGSGSLAATNLALKQKFEGKFSGTSVNLANTGTATGLQALANGKVDLAAIGRPLTPIEKGQGLMAIPIKREKIAMLVSQENPFKGSLTIHQFAKIFRGEITNWSEVGGQDAPIQLVDLPEVSDTRSSFPTYKLFQSAPFQAVATAKKLTEEDPAAIAQALDANSLGYMTADQVANLPGTRALLMHQTLPDDPRYPFSQPLAYVYEKGKLTPAAKAFLSLVVTPEGQAAIDETSSPGANLLDPKEEVATAIASVADPNAADPSATASPSPGSETPVAAVPNNAAPNSADPNSAVATAAPTTGTANAIVADGSLPGWLWWLLPLAGAGLLWWALKGRKGSVDATLPTGGADPDLAAAPIAEPNLAGAAAGTAAGAAAAIGAGAIAALSLDDQPRSANLSAIDLTDDDQPISIAALPTEGMAIAERMPRGGDESDGIDLGALGLGAAGLGAAGLGAAGLAAALGDRDGNAEATAITDISPVADQPEVAAVEPALEATLEPIAAPIPAIDPVAAPVAVEPLAATGGELPEAIANLPSAGAGVDLSGLGGVAALGALGAGAAGLAAMATGQSAEAPAEPLPDPSPEAMAIDRVEHEPITQLPAVAHAPTDLDDLASSEMASSEMASSEMLIGAATDGPTETIAGEAPAESGNIDLGAAAMLGGAMLTTGAAVSLAASHDEAQSNVEAAKFDVGQTDLSLEVLATVDEGLPDLPDGYDTSRILLMPRDPQWGYAYWDAPNADKERLRQQGGQQFALRMYDVTDIDINSQKPHSLQQYACEEMTRDWYLPIPVSDRDYLAEIGYVTGSGEWLLLARSNVVRIPPVYPSDWYNDQFMTVDWSENLQSQARINLGHPGTVGLETIHNQVFGLAADMEAMRVAGSMFGSMHQVPEEAISSFVFPSGVGMWALPTESGMGMSGASLMGFAGMSGVGVAGVTGMSGAGLYGMGMSGVGMYGLGMSGIGMFSASGVGMFSASAAPERSRKFWLLADAELIVYGATEPDAIVTIGGVPIKLNPDGTFSFRLSFQDGMLDYPIMAVAADGEQMRQIRMKFTRETPLRNTNTKDEAQEESF